MKLKRILTLVLMLALVIIGTQVSLAAPAGMKDGSSGGRDYYLYVPTDYDNTKSYPLVVMMHGCLQGADDFAEITNMNAIAQREGFIVLYPRQKATMWTERAAGCWLWFNSSHHSRGSGEPKIIADMTMKIVDNYNIDEDKIFAAGISAGGAMAVILASTYPDIYDGIGVHSGLQYGAATSSLYSSYAMLYESYALSTIAQGQKAYQQMQKSTPKPIPTIIFHGTADATVKSFNGRNVMLQMAVTNDLADDGVYNQSISFNNVQVTSLDTGRITQKYTILDSNGFENIVFYEIHGMNHAWSGGTKAYSSTSFSDPNGPNASELMWAFFNTDRTPESEEPDQPVDPINPDPVKETYEVTFDYHNGLESTVQHIQKGAYAFEPASKPEKLDHTFVSWQLNGEPFDFNTEITENITLVAHYVPNVISLEVDILNDTLEFINTLDVLISSNYEDANIEYSTDGITYYPYENDLVLEDTTKLFIKATKGAQEVVKEVTFTKVDPYQVVSGNVIQHFRAGRIDKYTYDRLLRVYGYRIQFNLYLVYGQTNWTTSPNV